MGIEYVSRIPYGYEEPVWRAGRVANEVAGSLVRRDGLGWR
jgi:hypothetical protein